MDIKETLFKRLEWAEGLIEQLPETHDGRNSFLINYGVKKHAQDLRANQGFLFDEENRELPRPKARYTTGDEDVVLDPANLEIKLQAIDWLIDMLSGCPVVLTGSTALFLYGMVEESDPYDLDLIIFGANHSTIGSLKLINKIQDAGQVIYEGKVRDAGECYPLAYRYTDKNSNDQCIKMHVFLMPLPTFEPLTFNTTAYENKRDYVSLNLPMKIIEAKQEFGRSKDADQLNRLASKIQVVGDGCKTEARLI